MHARRRPVRLLAAGAATVAGLGLAGLAATPAAAVEFPVDDYAGLVDAIDQASDDPGADVITIGGPITLEGDLPTIGTDLEIRGNGHTITAAGHLGLSVDGAWTVSIADLTIEAADGDGIVSRDADLTLTNVHVIGAGDDGLDAEGGSIAITGSDFVDNGNHGASILTNSGPVTITGSQFDENVENGLFVDARDASEVSVSLSGASDNEGIGFAFGASELAGYTLSGLTSVENLAGVLFEIGDEATVDGSGVTAERNQYEGLVLLSWGSASIDLRDSHATENGGSGALIEADEGSRIGLVRVDVVANTAHGYEIDAGPSVAVSIVESASTGNGEAGLEADQLTGDSELVVERSTLSGNGVTGARVDIVDDATFVVRNSTVSGNGAADGCVTGLEAFGGEGGSRFELLHSTVWGNLGDCPQVAYSFVGSALISHSIIAGAEWDLADSGEPDSTVEWSILGTFDPDASSPTLADAVADPSNLIADPELAPLADNGGPTWTHLLLDGSPALDAGDPGIADEPETDQRTLDRVVGDAIDIGAVEMSAAGDDPAGLPATGVAPAGIAGAALLLLLAGAAGAAVRRSRQV